MKKVLDYVLLLVYHTVKKPDRGPVKKPRGREENTMTNKIEAAKYFFQKGLISKETYIEELWEAGLLVWDEAIDLIVRANSDKRRGKESR